LLLFRILCRIADEKVNWQGRRKILMPICPYCGEEINALYSSLRRNLIWHDEKWLVEILDDESVIACSACYEELGPKDLDKLGITSKFR
jgi:hypothetical protein